MLRKMMLWLVLAGLGIVASAGSALADNPATGYIVLKCTVTLSVSIVGNSTYYFGDISAATTAYATTPIVFRNDSIGAICTWALNVDNTSLDGWHLDNAPGLDKFALFGHFRKTDQPTAVMFDVNADTLSVVAKQYSSTNFQDADYNGDGYGGQASIILPKNYADTIGSSADRKLWIKLQTPIAVTDQNLRTIRIIVTAAMAS